MFWLKPESTASAWGAVVPAGGCLPSSNVITAATRLKLRSRWCVHASRAGRSI